MNKIKCRKQVNGQVVSLDLLVSMIIFIVLIGLLFSAWNDLSRKLNAHQEYDRTVGMALRITDILVQTSGKPTDWELDPDRAMVIGLAQNDRNISSSKVGVLRAMDYDIVRDKLNIGSYDFNLTIGDVSYGVSSPNQSIVSINRLVLYENEETLVQFKLWIK